MTSVTNATPPFEFLDALRPLFDCLSDGVCLADADGRLLYANDAAGRLLGPAALQAEERPICELLCAGLAGSNGETAAACPAKTPGGTQDAATFKGVHRATGRDLRVRCMRVRLGRAEEHFLIIEDVAAQAERGRRREELRQMFAHDVRVPLTNALGALRTLEDAAPGHAISPGEAELIRIGVRGCGRISALVDAYLETSRLEEGAMPLHLATVEILALVRDCAGEQAEAARSRNLELCVAAPEGLAVRADPELLHRALLNLIGNALKFTQPGGRVSVAASAENGEVLIRVSDNGPGISARDLPRVFERFYQGSAGGRRSGFGLGLTFCRAALRAMGGEVTAESEEGKGSVFTLRLPGSAPRKEAAP